MKDAEYKKAITDKEEQEMEPHFKAIEDTRAAIRHEVEEFPLNFYLEQQ